MVYLVRTTVKGMSEEQVLQQGAAIPQRKTPAEWHATFVMMKSAPAGGLQGLQTLYTNSLILERYKELQRAKEHQRLKAVSWAGVG
jgi:hypothetical protein